MPSVAAVACPKCRRECGEGELVCGLCGEMLRRERRLPEPEADELARSAPAAVPMPAPPEWIDASKRREQLEPWLFLGLGAITGPVFGLTPMLGYMGWFLASLVHEMGHAGFAWFCGMPAFPAIALDGHAAAMHGEQSPALVIGIALALAAVAWHKLAGRTRWIAVGIAGFLYPAFAFSSAREVLHLLAGHGGELAFATLALWKCLDGGFTRSKPERLLYGTVGWFLVGRNAFLCFGLMTSEAARAEYDTSGSFGLTNDYQRIAEDLLYWRLESVAALMLVATLLVVPLAIALTFLWRRLHRAA